MHGNSLGYRRGGACASRQRLSCYQGPVAYLLLYRSARDEAVNDDVPPLTDAPRALARLNIGGWVPVCRAANN